MDAELIRAGRALLGWSQGDLAGRARVERRVVARYEAGTHEPHAQNLAALVEALRAAGVEEVRKRDGSIGVVIRGPELKALRAARSTGGS